MCAEGAAQTAVKNAPTASLAWHGGVSAPRVVPACCLLARMRCASAEGFADFADADGQSLRPHFCPRLGKKARSLARLALAPLLAASGVFDISPRMKLSARAGTRMRTRGLRAWGHVYALCTRLIA